MHRLIYIPKCITQPKLDYTYTQWINNRASAAYMQRSINERGVAIYPHSYSTCLVSHTLRAVVSVCVIVWCTPERSKPRNRPHITFKNVHYLSLTIFTSCCAATAVWIDLFTITMVDMASSKCYDVHSRHHKEIDNQLKVIILKGEIAYDLCLLAINTCHYVMYSDHCDHNVEHLGDCIYVGPTYWLNISVLKILIFQPEVEWVASH